MFQNLTAILLLGNRVYRREILHSYRRMQSVLIYKSFIQKIPSNSVYNVESSENWLHTNLFASQVNASFSQCRTAK